MATVATQLEAQEPVPLDIAAEVRLLRRWSYGTLGVLVAVAAGCAAGLVFVLPDHPLAPGSERLMATAILGGVLGSAISALRSVCDRIARGFELDDGHRRWPPHAPHGEKMTVRMIPYLLVRPVLGAGTGLVAYAGVVGGFLIATSREPATFSGEGILFFALLAGLFAKTFLVRMDIVFKTLLGEQPASGHPPTHTETDADSASRSPMP
jgi:hypothetical protein